MGGDHRVAVLDDEDRIADVLTQSDLIHFFDSHSKLFPTLVQPKLLRTLGGRWMEGVADNRILKCSVRVP